MKNLVLVISMTLATLTFGTETIGGMLKTRDGQKLRFSCEVTENVCETINVETTWDRYSDFITRSSIEIEPTEMSRDAFRSATRSLNQGYMMTGIVGTGVATVICGYGSGIACLLIPVGVAIDIAKAPVVGAMYIGHKLGDLLLKRRFKKHFKFLMDSKNKDKFRKVSERDLEALLQVLY